MSLFRPEVAALKAYAMADERAIVKVNQNECRTSVIMSPIGLDRNVP